MPKSRGRKKPAAKKMGVTGGVLFSSLSIGEQSHDAFKQRMLRSVHNSVAEFPGLVETLHRLLRERAPEDVLATFAFYGARASMGIDGATQALTKDVQQHHIELLQAIILTLPADDWGLEPSSAHSIQIAFDTVPKLADTFMRMRILERDDESDSEKRAVLLLQEKIRLQTQAVRNWGYYSEVVRITRELYSPLDARLKARVGFSATDLIDVAEKLLAEAERWSEEHFQILGRVLRGRTIEELIQRYYQHMPGLRGTPEEFMAIVPMGTSREEVVGSILSHSDLRHLEAMTFTVAEVAGLTGKPSEVVKKILDALSLKPGALVGTEIRQLFLTNAVWARPGIKFLDRFLFAIPQAIFSHINEIMRTLAETAKLEEVLSSRRAAYLEGKMAETLQVALPTARILQNAKWTLGDQLFETDLIVVVDKTLIIAEAKSHRVTPQGLRGAPDRLKRHLSDLIIGPSIQSERLARLVANARAGDVEAQAVVNSLDIDAKSIDIVIRVSVTLDDLSILSSSEEALSAAGWIPSGHSLAPALHVADLICIAEILDNELLFLHYFAERFHFQKQFDLMGDELDFLGLYLSTGFNVGPRREDFKHMVISGLSEPIDRFFVARDAGLKLPKPRVNMRPLYQKIVDRLLQRKPKGWSTIGIHLLSSADPEEQKDIERGLIRLRKSVRSPVKEPRHECFMEIIPALNRKAIVGFFVYRDSEKDGRCAKIEQLASESLDRGDARVCVIFGRNADRWVEPYEVVLMALANDTD